ncbi:MAG: class I SAM-dependent methyltransferase [Syntrophaceae bacterium]|nr:class I SAM-dependent methyltransferase [Syntrophaceae bacterium]
MDKAGKTYWDERWENPFLPEAINPYRKGPNHYLDRKFHAFFCTVFSRWETKNRRLLEIGCARSAWLPYFAKEFGFKVYGIDYSEAGCQQAMQVLSNEGAKGKIVCADFFSPPEWMIGKFDVVISFGVLEHFQDTQNCISAFSAYLKPKGIMITNIPNFTGLLGSIQKLMNRNVFNMHAPLSLGEIAEAHRKNMLELIFCDYFLAVNFGVVNFENMKDGIAYKWILQSFCWLNRIIWFIEELIPIKPNRWFSPYINCVGIKF